MQPIKYTYNFIPNIYREFNGKKYTFCGVFKNDNKFIKDLKRTFFRNGFYTKTQSVGNEVTLWSRKR